MNKQFSLSQSLPLIALAGLAIGLGLFVANANYDWQGLILIGALIGIVAVFVIPRLARSVGGPDIAKVLGAALVAKFVFAMVRNWFAFGVYGGSADASGYNQAGTIISHYIWNLDFAPISAQFHWGTSFVMILTGIIYSITGPSIYAGYLVYSFLAFLGSYFYYRAFTVAFPQGNSRLFLILIFFFPSILYWPNGIGKDALMLLFMGLSAYGSARLIRNQIRGLIPLAIGFGGILLIRPHIAMVLALALGFALVVRGFKKQSIGPATYIIALIAVGAFTWFLVPSLAAELGIEDLSFQGVTTTFVQQQDFTFEGGSAFQVVDITDPFRLPGQLFGIIFRPFPWETNNVQALVQSLEGALMLGLILWKIKNIGRALVNAMSDPYLRYIIISIFSLLMVFTAIANFGILVRERAMMLPFLLKLICYKRAQDAPEKIRTLPAIGTVMAQPVQTNNPLVTPRLKSFER